MNDSPQRIIAAIGAGDSEALVRFASDQAASENDDLHLVHVLHMPASGGESFSLALTTAREIGRAALDSAAKRARGLLGDRGTVTTELVDDGPGTVAALVVRSPAARMVVLQHRRRGRLLSLATGSTTYGVAARAHCPVVSVPETWRPAEVPADLVTIGVHDAEASDDILRVGFELARERGAAVRVLHAWWLANGYDDVIVDRDLHDAYARRAHDELAPHVQALRAQFPDTRVDQEVRHVAAAFALVEASHDSDLVVIGRRQRSLPIGSHLGSVARTTIRESSCPVVVVEPHPQRATARKGDRLVQLSSPVLEGVTQP